MKQIVMMPAAHLKLRWMCERGDTEVGGFGSAYVEDDRIIVEDFIMPRQTCSAAYFDPDMMHVSDMMAEFATQGILPSRWMRVWIHTHPGESCEPSSKDEQTFKEDFGNQDWAVMLIMGKTGKFYARLKVRTDDGIYAEQLVPVGRYWHKGWKLPPNFEELWEAEYVAKVRKWTAPPKAVPSIPNFRQLSKKERRQAMRNHGELARTSQGVVVVHPNGVVTALPQARNPFIDKRNCLNVWNDRTNSWMVLGHIEATLKSKGSIPIGGGQWVPIAELAQLALDLETAPEPIAFSQGILDLTPVASGGPPPPPADQPLVSIRSDELAERAFCDSVMEQLEIKLADELDAARNKETPDGQGPKAYDPDRPDRPTRVGGSKPRFAQPQGHPIR